MATERTTEAMDGEAEETFESPSRSKYASVVAVAALTLIAALGNSFLTWVFWHAGTNQFVLFWNFVAIGCLVSQPLALTVWCVLSSQRAIVRISLSMSILAGLTLLYIFALVSMESQNPPPAEAMIVVGIIPVAGVIIAAMPLSIFRIASGCRLSNISHTDAEPTQYGIKHLFLLTLVCAIFMPVANFVVQRLRFDSGPASWQEVVFLLCVYTLLACLICLLSIAAVFRKDNRFAPIALLIISALSLPFLALWLIESNSRNMVRFDLLNYLYAIGFTISIAITLCVTFSIFYWIGYRIRKLP